MEQSLRTMKIGSIVIAIVMAVLLTMCGGGGKPTPPCVTSPGIMIEPASGLLTSESGGTDSFTVVLNSKPEADVSIGIYCQDTSEGTISPSSLTFTPGNWDLPQTVTVSGVDDEFDDGNQVYFIVTAPASSTDSDYLGTDPEDVMVFNIDNDTHSSTGVHHNVAVKSDGTLWTWGDNQQGQLGDGTDVDKNTPTQIGTDTFWITMAAGSRHTAGVKTNDTLWV
jgi:hypothetical protein